MACRPLLPGPARIVHPGDFRAWVFSPWCTGGFLLQLSLSKAATISSIAEHVDHQFADCLGFLVIGQFEECNTMNVVVGSDSGNAVNQDGVKVPLP